jgi:hypothetical protein
MVEKEYWKAHSSISPQYAYPGVEMRFCWMGHRGIFYFRNTQKGKRTIQMEIKKGFAGDIKFEDERQYVKEETLGKSDHKLFVVVRGEDREYGPFYKINIKT